jgi:hypothetical protein
MSNMHYDDASPDSPQAGRTATSASRGRPLSREERLTITYGILCIVVILVVLQLWLLTATMNAYLGGEESIIWPAALASLVCFGLNLGLLRYLYRLDR